MQTRGFTLIELLVALFITAILFTMGYGGINQALTDREAIRTRQDRLSEVQMGMRLLAQDFAQIAPRPVREPVGSGWQPALRGGPEGEPLIVFTRSGWANPAGIGRPALQRVAYVLEDGTLRREHWPVLDATLTSTRTRRDVLGKVRSVRFRYMDPTREWREQWPLPTNVVPAANPALPDLRMRPLAVEVTLDLEDWGQIVRIFEVSG